MKGHLQLKSERGQSLVEFAFVVPLVLALAVGIVLVGNFYRKYQAITDATGTAARTAAICRTGSVPANTAGTAADPTATFTFAITSGSGTNAGTAAPCDVTSGSTIQVVGTAPTQNLHIISWPSFLGGGSLDLSLPLSSTVTVVEE